MDEKDFKQKSFDLTIFQLGEETRNIYKGLLLDRQIELAKENGGKTATVPIEEREKMLFRARQIAQNGNVDSQKMAKEWDKHELRAPIGGAQDD